jgi:hypothetical protein
MVPTEPAAFQTADGSYNSTPQLRMSDVRSS